MEDSPSRAATMTPSSSASPMIWGLTPREIHDAFWHARGVQCVRRGSTATLQRAAELYLLLEPGQLVMFNVAPLSERLTWQNAAVCRVRLVAGNEQAYRERVIVDDRGLVQRIERQYRPESGASSRVVLTSSRRLAGLWMAATSRREGWDRVRRAVSWPRVDHYKCSGLACVEGDPAQERRLLDGIVQRWPSPAQSIDGLQEREAGVWHATGEAPAAEAVRVGPLWLGYGAAAADHRCLVGPRWLADRAPSSGSTGAVRPRPIAQVELVASPRRAGSRPPDLTYAFLKRCMDVVLSGTALIALLPAFVIIALCIVLEDGFPIFFAHARQGRAGRPFKCWKFRTMHRHAEDIARDLEAYNVCDGPQVFIRDDPRVTRVGKWLRKSHLDEIPQFFNVLTGQMSLVGPRPSPDDENQYCPAWRDTRLSVRPGITGLWQLNRRREPGEDFQEWIKYDIEYVQRASLRLDLHIMVKTAWIILRGRSEHAPQ
ncbi:MAG: sugar transferase [Planctomycetota bacterium]|nr:sugar transferase [Planctomycetota bacterium]